jgi:hypothetical protein
MTDEVSRLLCCTGHTTLQQIEASMRKLTRLIAWVRECIHGNILCKAEKASLDGIPSGASRGMSKIASHGRDENKVVDGSRRH